MAKLEIPCETLKQLYCRKQLSAPKIAMQYNCSAECIYSHLRECKIVIRARGHNKAVQVSKEELENLYLIELWAFKDIAEYFHTSEDTICRKLRLYNIPKRHYRTCKVCDTRFSVEIDYPLWHQVCPSCESVRILCPCGCRQPMPKYRCSGELSICAKPASCKTPARAADLKRRHNETWETRICKNCGDAFEIQQCLSNMFCSRPCSEKYQRGPNHGCWKGGTSKEPYPFEFDTDLKERVRQRDNYTCQVCGIPQNEYFEQYKERLSCHHINYLKDDLRPENLISLCRSCHSKTHYNRPYWQSFFEAKIKQIYS